MTDSNKPHTFGQRPTTLYVSDLDGTLLDSCSRISSRSAAIISRLSRQGVLITVATARTPATVVPLMAEAYTTVPYITMTGAALWHPLRGEFADVRLIDPDVAADVRRVVEAHGLHPFIYTIRDDGRRLEAFHNGPMLPAEREFVALRTGLALKRFRLDEPEGMRVTLPRTILFFAMGAAEATAAVAAELSRRGGCAISCYADTNLPDMGLIEIFAPAIDKGAVARRLAASLGAERIVAFGDNINDLPLLRAADLAVAVENALPEVRAAAATTIGPNTADAVAEFIEADIARTAGYSVGD